VKVVSLFLALAAAFAQTPDRRVAPPAQPGRRVALVVGNAAYASGPLRNPVNDAQAVAATLRDLGFAVQLATNVDLPGFDRTVTGFAQSLHAGDVALFYYSGHGMQVDGENYLVPVDFQATEEADVRFKTMPATRVHERMQASGASLSIVVLDACRDNPFRPGRSAAGGLASMNSGKGSLIAFATSPGATASDNPSAANGLFTKYLLETLREPGLDVEDIFKRVRQQVAAASENRQVPWTASSVIGTYVLRDPAEERAKLERDLADLERQVADARTRKAEQEQADKERQAASVRARLNIPPPAPPEDTVAAERSRLDDLRRQRDQQQVTLAALGGKEMTLEEAQLEVTSLEVRIERTRKEFNAVRDEALKRLPPAEKGMFETTAEFEARKSQTASVRAEAEKRYADEFESAVQGERARIAVLELKTYPIGSAKLEFVSYDADANRLTVKFGGADARITIPPAKAQALYGQIASVRVERALAGSVIILIDPSSRDKFPGSIGRMSSRDGQWYVWIPPGSFAMGCSPGDADCDENEKPTHQVSLSRGFWLGDTSVGSHAGPSAQGVTWDQAQTYCRSVGMRLPTEAEWEYAARAGSTAARLFAGSSSDWPNAFGLFGMFGNVWQWTADWYGPYSSAAQIDPSGAATSEFKVLRGGSWLSQPKDARVSSRRWDPAGYPTLGVGFRCAGDQLP
jgi:uncharacterized caspase-like protein/formylglycine-generating enzyme required for sulfatase activity